MGYPKDLADWQEEAWIIAERQGFHAQDAHLTRRERGLIRLGLVHTEISEAMQLIKRHWTEEPTQELKNELAEELADAMIRLFDFAEAEGLSLTQAIRKKNAKNLGRPYQYGTPDEIKRKDM